MRRFLLFTMVLCCSLPGLANSESNTRNRVSFQVEATREVPNDWVTTRLSVVAEGKDPAIVANSVNRQMTRARATSKTFKGVEVRSGAYTTRPLYELHMRAESDPMSMSSSNAAPPLFDSGTSEVRIQLNGNVELD